MKAMILAAGRGERLRPLTDRVPKALVEVAGKPLLVRHLERLAQAGCREVVVNVSHLPGLIMERIGDGARFGLRVAFSVEAEALETAGGIANALPLLGDAPFVLVNADVYCEYDFARLRAHRLREALAHLLLVPNPPHRPRGDFSLEDARVGDGTAPRYTYAGVAVMSPTLLSTVTPGSRAALAPLLYAAAARGAVTGELYRGVWRDVGTPERLAELEALVSRKVPMP